MIDFGNDDFDLDKAIQEVLADRFDHTKPTPNEESFLVEINGARFATPGAVIGVIGNPKTRKSSVMAMIAAATLSKDGVYQNVKSYIKGSVLWFDTEQTDTEINKFWKNIVTMSDVEDDDFIKSMFFGLKLRKYSEEERLQIVDRIVTAKNAFSKLGAIFLDGVGDLIEDTNERAASKRLITRLTYWADLLDIPLFVALHTNKDGKNSTGALGAFLDRKCSGMIRTLVESEDSEHSQVKIFNSRNGARFRPFMLGNNEQGLPVVFDGLGDIFDITLKPKMKIEIEEDPDAKDINDVLT